MANKKNWLEILAIMLVFGMTVVGCDNGSSNDGGGSFKNISDFGSAVLGYSDAFQAGANHLNVQANVRATVGFDLSDFNFLLDAIIESDLDGDHKEKYIVDGNRLYTYRNDLMVEGYDDYKLGKNYERDINVDGTFGSWRPPTTDWAVVYGMNPCVMLAELIRPFFTAEYDKTDETAAIITYIAKDPSAIALDGGVAVITVKSVKIEISTDNSMLLTVKYESLADDELEKVDLTMKIVLGGQKVTFPSELL